jgi:multidrug efflux pump subunit AcrA (membrane-fusion protein)
MSRLRARPLLWVNVGLAIALVAALAIALVALRSTPQAAAATTRTATVRTGTVTATVTGSGNVASATAVAVNFQTGGTVKYVAVKAGQKVRKGQRLATLDDTSAREALASARAQLASAQAQYDQTAAGATSQQRAKDALAVQAAQQSVTSAGTGVTAAERQRRLDASASAAAVATAKAALKAHKGTQTQVDQAVQQQRQTALKDDQSIAQARQQVDQARNQLSQQELTQQQDAAGATPAQLAQASAAVRSAQAQVDQAQQTLDATTLTAPSPGTVLAVNGVAGQTVSGGGTSSAASTASSGSGSGSGGTGSSGGAASSASAGSSSTSGFITLADLDALQVTASIGEADAAAVKVGQTATVTLVATGATATGAVTSVALQGTTSNNVVQYPVTVTLDQAPDGARLGATATVSITTGSAENATLVSSSAVTTLGRRHTVTVLRGGQESVVPVQVGLVGDNGTQILSGLSAGDTVVLPSVSSASNGGGFPFGVGGGLGR